MSGMRGSPDESNALIANALYKLLYASGVTLPKGTKGDIKNLAANNNKSAKTLVPLSALTDLYAALNPDAKWRAGLDMTEDGNLIGKVTIPW